MAILEGREIKMSYIYFTMRKVYPRTDKPLSDITDGRESVQRLWMERIFSPYVTPEITQSVIYLYDCFTLSSEVDKNSDWR